jgi:K+-sensing histidine kinase KdpD
MFKDADQLPVVTPGTTAPPAEERATTRDLERQRAIVRATHSVVHALEYLPTVTIVINRHRQIVYANQAFADMLNVPDCQSLFGQRLGEAASCRHSDETPGGCGTTEFCATCGAAKAQIAAIQGQVACEECRIISKTLGNDLNLRLWARPVTLGGEAFTMLTVVDISHEKRREALERIFFHDVLNTAGGVQGIAMLLTDPTVAERYELATRLAQVSTLLVDEIQAQRDLMAMERGDFEIRPRAVGASELLAEVVETYRHHELAATRAIRVAARSEPVTLITDATLLRRVIGNMTKNALEACPRGGAVTLTCRTRDDRVVFSVHNSAEMPRDVQLQVFQRSFSTKGVGRGLGTYSMKLISERYLHGRVSFVSTADQGTVFSAEYPRVLAAASSDASDARP